MEIDDQKDPCVSVIIPCYNEADYVECAVRSALEQDYPNIEVIVVDDGSVDDTGDVVRRNFGESIRIMRQENSGLAASRNFGASGAKGDYLFFIDADDRFLPGALSMMMERIQKSPECGLVTSDIFYGRNFKDLVIPDHQSEGEEIITAEQLIVKNRIWSAVLVRKEAFQKAGGYDTEMITSEDRDFEARVAADYEVVKLIRKFLFITNREDSMSKDAARMKLGAERFLGKCKASGRFSHLNESVWKRANAVLAYQTSTVYFEQSKWMEAFRELFLSFRHALLIQREDFPSVPLFFRMRRLLILLRNSLFLRKK